MKPYLIASCLAILVCLTGLGIQGAEGAEPKSWVHSKDTLMWKAEPEYPLCEGFTCPTPDGLFSNAQNCSTFCHCTNNIPEMQACPSGLVYDPIKQECDFPYNVPCTTCNVAGCCVTCPTGTTATTAATTRTTPTTEAATTSTTARTPSTTATTETTASSTERTTTPTTSRTTTTPTTGTTPVMFQCPEPNGFFPISPQECGNEYYVCVDGSPYIQSCPNNGIFDPVTLVCVEEQYATCRANFRCPAPDGFFPIEGQCTSYYYICVSNQVSYGNCPEPGSIFDPMVNKCVSGQDASCGTVQTTTPVMFTCPAGVTGKYPYPNDCRRYYNCQSNGDYIISYCPPGQWFVPEIGFCENPSNYPPPSGCSP